MLPTNPLTITPVCLVPAGKLDSHNRPGRFVLLRSARLLLLACAIAAMGTPARAQQGNPNGSNPYGGVIRDQAGNLYGTTRFGGLQGTLCFGTCGVVFKLDTAGHETVLYTFTGGADGGLPYAGVIGDSEGNLYGTTYVSADVFKVNARGITVLHSFPTDAIYAPLARDSAGNLYGATSFLGVVFKIDSQGNTSTLHSFGIGFFPSAVTLDSAGNLYWTTQNGGNQNCLSGCGQVFKLNTLGNLTVLYTFSGGADGALPVGGLVRDPEGALYGVTQQGGDPSCLGIGCGVVFRLDSGGYRVLHAFAGGADGATPQLDSPVVLDHAGNLYGTTGSGGVSGVGVLFKLDPAGNETVLHTFTGGSDGGVPSGRLAIDGTGGNLYGTTQLGGATGRGVVYEVNVATQQETVLWDFPAAQ